MSLDRSLFTAVVPVYNEEDNLEPLVRRLDTALAALGFDDHEMLFVSDGSTDRSEEIIERLAAGNPRIRALFLSRNFGHQAAVSLGLEHARGSVVSVLDADLQDPPEVLPRLVAALAQGADVAYGVRARRKEGSLKRVAYYLYYRLLRTVSSVAIPLDAGDFCCMRRRVVADLTALPERRRFVRGLRAWVGFRQVGVEYDRDVRAAGEPKYGLVRLVRLAYDGLFGFTSLPVKLMQLLGFAISALALLTAAVYFAGYLLAPQRFNQGFASLIISIWFLAGVQLLFLGVLGEYVSRIFDESRRRPIAIVRRTVDGRAESGAGRA